MEHNDLYWKKNASLSEMMDRFNALVDQMTTVSMENTAIRTGMETQKSDIEESLHTLNDTILTVNFKLDAIKQYVDDQVDDLLRSMKRYHPES